MEPTIEERIKQWMVEKGISPSDADMIIQGGSALLTMLSGVTKKKATQAGEEAAAQITTADEAERIVRGEE